MSTSNVGQNYESDGRGTAIAEEAIEAYRGLKMGTVQGQVLHSTAIDDVVIGISTNKVAIGGKVDFQKSGVALIQCKAALTLHAQVMPTASGAGKISDAAGATARSVGVCLQATTTDGQVAAVRINLPNLSSAANS